MRTVKRSPRVFDDNIGNINKYLNQTEFKGINEDKNIFAIDQETMSDANNVYIDDKKRLVSRPTLQKDTLPKDAVATGYSLIDIKEFANCKIYISKKDTYNIAIILNDNTKPTNYLLSNITKYNISNINQYIICFNDVNAQIYNINNTTGWEPLSNSVYIPVTKRVVGSVTTTNTKNQFTDRYKEEYVLTDNAQPILPDGTANTVTVTTTSGSFTQQNVFNINEYTEDRILRPTSYTQDTTGKFVSAAKNVVCVATNTYVDYSINYGETFDRIYYPNYSNFFGIAEVSKNGKYFFFVATSGVYRCLLTEQTWSIVFRGPENTDILGIPGYGGDRFCNIRSYFLTGDVFCFLTTDGTANTYLYFKGNGLYSGTNYADDYMDPTKDNYYYLQFITTINFPTETTLYSLWNSDNLINRYYDTSRNISMKVINNVNNIDTTVISMTFSRYTEKDSYIIFIHGGDTQSYTSSTKMFSKYAFLKITDGTLIQGASILSTAYDTIDTTTNTTKLISIQKCEIEVNNKLYIANIAIGNDIDYKYSDEQLLYDIGYTETLPEYNNGIFFFDWLNAIYIETDKTIYFLPSFATGYTIVSDNNFYKTTTISNSNGGFTLWTNSLQSSDIISIQYLFGNVGTFITVPDTSYSDTEMYLGFSNTLKITKNEYDSNNNILFNLPIINNQVFTDNITGLSNISTTEIAIFFKDKIKICSKSTDDTLGYKYEYNNTKLSLGIRLGDDTINTLEGKYTIFPTIRGLAIMNYQAFMATTDQTVEYITDSIKYIWLDFWNNSELANKQIKIIQHCNRLFLTNGTGTILLYNITTHTWWKWTIPVNVLFLKTDQVTLRAISNDLLLFKLSDTYYDFSESRSFNSIYEDKQPIQIDWKIASQPLYFKAPTYWKNLKQLVFELSESQTTDKTATKTMNAQIKLYRKNLELKDPETIQFRIETLRTFVKRFNYWKINELQWILTNDTETVVPKRLELNAIAVKYEIGEEVR